MKVLKKIKKQIALLSAVALTVTSLQMNTFVVKAAKDDTTKFAVLSTTDMHGKCWDKNLLNDTSVDNSLLKVATAVTEIRKAYTESNVILIDNGDTYQGTPVSSYSITSADKTFDGMTPMAMAAKYIKYDAVVLGNHEFNYPWETMQKIYGYLESTSGGAVNVPVLAANLVWKETKGANIANENVFKPYTTKVIKVGNEDFKIGILGLENTDCTR